MKEQQLWKSKFQGIKYRDIRRNKMARGRGRGQEKNAEVGRASSVIRAVFDPSSQRGGRARGGGKKRMVCHVVTKGANNSRRGSEANGQKRGNLAVEIVAAGPIKKGGGL